MKLFFVSLFGAVAVSAALPTPQATQFAPLDYFESKCARCHGSYGSFYGDNFGQKLTDEQLKNVVRDMANGPAGAPLEEKDLNVLVAWHKALRDKQPFIAVTNSEKTQDGWKLQGEASPSATIELDGTPVPLTGHKWESLAKSEAPLQLTVHGTGETKTILQARQQAYAPAEAPPVKANP